MKRWLIATTVVASALAAPAAATADDANYEYSAMQGVSCPTPTFCLAVGFYGQVVTGVSHPLVEKWDGTAWSIVPFADPPTSVAVAPALSAISCVSDTDCETVGFDKSYYGHTFAGHWNGTGWKLETLPSGGHDAVGGLSCGSPTFCMAFGFDGGVRAVQWRWNGTGWTRSTPPALRPLTTLSGLSCPTARSCFAAAQFTKKPGEKGESLIEHWNGRGWSVVPTKLPVKDGLGSIACPEPHSCTATGSVGGYYSRKHPLKMVVANWSAGHPWTAAVLPLSPGVFEAALGDVSCATVRICTAIVTYNESLDGDPAFSQSIASRGATGGFHMYTDSSLQELEAISCAGSSCMAVGFGPVPGGQDCTCAGPGSSIVIDQARDGVLEDSHPAPPPNATTD